MAYRIENGEVHLIKAPSADPFDNPYATFTEWVDELDSVYDNL